MKVIFENSFKLHSAEFQCNLVSMLNWTRIHIIIAYSNSVKKNRTNEIIKLEQGATNSSS